MSSSDPGEPMPIDPEDVEISVRERPHYPFWKDERIFGQHGPKAKHALRFLIISMVISLIVIAWGILLIFNTIHANHTSRINDQNKIKAQLKEDQRQLGLDRQAIAELRNANQDLACSTYLYFIHQPGVDRNNGFLQLLNTRYDCAHFKPSANPLPETSGPSGHTQRSGSASPSREVGAPAQPTATSTPGSTRPTPTPTPSVHPSTSVTTVTAPRPPPVTTTDTFTSPPGVICTIQLALLHRCIL